MTIRLTNNKNFDPTVYESFIDTIYDKQAFKENFMRVKKFNTDLRGWEIVPFIPYSYQNAWSDDDRSQKAANKSRQVGFSFNEMADVLIDALTIPNYTKLVTSVTQPQANNLLKNIPDIINLMQPEFRPRLKSAARNIIEFEHNSSRVLALPTSDSAVRSYNGDIFLDELAHIPNDGELLDAILSVTVREGWTVHVGSTPYGQRGRFHKIFKEAGWDTSTEWHDKNLVGEFFRNYNTLLQENKSDWSTHLMTWWMCPDLYWERIIKKAKTRDALRQEYGLAFLDETTAMISYQVLLDHVKHDLPQFDAEKKYKKPSHIRRIGGLDPAEKGNQTAFVVFDKIDNVYYKKYKKTWTYTSHTTYNPEIVWQTINWGLDKLYVDETGMGIPIVSNLKLYLPPSILQGVTFSNTQKEGLVYNMVSLYEAGYDPINQESFNENKFEIWTDHDVDYMDQLHQLRKEKNKMGKNVYSGKIEGKQDDIIWGTALALSENIDLSYGGFSIEEVIAITNRSDKYGYKR